MPEKKIVIIKEYSNTTDRPRGKKTEKCALNYQLRDDS